MNNLIWMWPHQPHTVFVGKCTSSAHRAKYHLQYFSLRFVSLSRIASWKCNFSIDIASIMHWADDFEILLPHKISWNFVIRFQYSLVCVGCRCPRSSRTILLDLRNSSIGFKIISNSSNNKSSWWICLKLAPKPSLHFNCVFTLRMEF